MAARPTFWVAAVAGIIVLLGYLTMLFLWQEGSSFWIVVLAFIFVGIGIGLSSPPASRSLTGSVPVTRVGMASGTADLQRDLGGAIFTALFGALLAAGYAAARVAEVAARAHAMGASEAVEAMNEALEERAE